MAICDLCGQKCQAHQLEQLLESYRIPGVEDVCPDCSRWASKAKGDMLLQIAPRMREEIANRKGMPPPKWWHRFIKPAPAYTRRPPPPPPRPPM